MCFILLFVVCWGCNFRAMDVLSTDQQAQIISYLEEMGPALVQFYASNFQLIIIVASIMFVALFFLKVIRTFLNIGSLIP